MKDLIRFWLKYWGNISWVFSTVWHKSKKTLHCWTGVMILLVKSLLLWNPYTRPLLKSCSCPSQPRVATIMPVRSANTLAVSTNSKPSVDLLYLVKKGSFQPSNTIITGDKLFVYMWAEWLTNINTGVNHMKMKLDLRRLSRCPWWDLTECRILNQGILYTCETSNWRCLLKVGSYDL